MLESSRRQECGALTKNFHTYSVMKSSRNSHQKLPVFSVTQEILINLFKAAQQSLDVIPDGSDSSTSLSTPQEFRNNAEERGAGEERKEGERPEKVRKSGWEGRADR